jgi:hypothetical protein
MARTVHKRVCLALFSSFNSNFLLESQMKRTASQAEFA